MPPKQKPSPRTKGSDHKHSSDNSPAAAPAAAASDAIESDQKRANASQRLSNGHPSPSIAVQSARPSLVAEKKAEATGQTGSAAGEQQVATTLIIHLWR
jgi:hypothetical protein